MPDEHGAERRRSARVVASAMRRASVVLPVPGGPHRMIDCRRSRSIASRSGLPGAEQLLLADELVERARPHPLGERSRCVRRRRRGLVVKQRHRTPAASRCGTLPRRLVDDQRGRDGGVQRFDRRLHRDRHALVGAGDDGCGQAGTFAAEQDRAVSAKIAGRQGSAAVAARGNDAKPG